MSRLLYGAIEAGGSKFVCAVADANGHWLAETRVTTTTPTATLTAVQDFFAAQAGATGRFAGIGIAAFGPLDLRRESSTFGHLLATPKQQWSHTDLCTPFAARFDCRVAIDTDVNAAALAEARNGAGRGCEHVVYVTVGTGIGGGVIVNGEPLHGALHPEMGHIRVQKHAHDHDFAGICPFHGDCLEGLASGPAVIARYGTTLDRLPASSPAIDVIGHHLGQLACNIVLLLSPQRIIFGGGVMQNGALLPAIRRTTVTLLNGYAGLGEAAAVEHLIVAPGLGERSGIEGALLLATANS